MTTVPLPNDEARLALAVATAAAGVLPTPEPLTPAAMRTGSAEALRGYAGAVLADLEGQLSGRVAVLVGEELVGALEASPLGGLDLAAALQPTMDAVAEALHARVGAARVVDVDLVASDLGNAFSLSQLVGATTSAAVLLPEYTLRAALRAPDLLAAISQGPNTAPAFPGASDQGPMLGVRSTERRRGIELLHGVDMEVTVEIGRARLTVRELLDLSPGAVLELDRAAGSPADLLVNGRLIARGEVVVVDEDFGLRITEIVTDAAAG
ncbi:MAG: flagellar motor switch protein FliN [Nocardioides sp.]